MPAPRSVWLTSLFIVVACSGGTPRVPPLAPGATILAFGDSLTFGTGAEPGEAYPAVLAALTGCAVINAGVPGDVTASGVERLPALLDEHRPDLVILLHGGNDILQRRSATAMAENLRTMAEMARRRGAAVVLVGVPQFGLFFRPPDLYADLAKELALPYDGESLAELERNPALKSDPIHLNAAGYRLLAERIHALLHAAGAV
ncbi:MAG: arylesterase [Nitrospirota bacterium]|jgi:lysophospholipase L1-like esterase